MSGNFTVRSFSINIEDLPFLAKLEKLGEPDNKSQSAMVVIAIKEYVERHFPGNPNLTFDRLGGLIFPPSALEILSAKAPKTCFHCSSPATRQWMFKTGAPFIFTCNIHKPNRHDFIGYKPVKT